MTDYLKSVKVNATPQEVYDVLMSSERHSQLTGGPAKIENKENGVCMYFGDNITGINKTLTLGKLIAQKWRIKPWEENFYTDLKITFEENESGTVVTFDHKNIPEANFEMIVGGWEQNYVAKLPDFFSK